MGNILSTVLRKLAEGLSAAADDLEAEILKGTARATEPADVPAPAVPEEEVAPAEEAPASDDSPTAPPEAESADAAPAPVPPPDEADAPTEA